MSDEEFNRRENMYRFLDDYPDFEFLVTIITIDGLALVLHNDP